MGPSQTRGGDAGAPPARTGPAAPVKAEGAGAAAAGAPVLYDARERAKLPPGVERDPKLTPEVEKLVLSALSSEEEAGGEDCEGKHAPFHVTASATGAFTAPGTRQAAYVVAGKACDAAKSGGIQATHLLIVEGNDLVLAASGRKDAADDALAFYGTEIRAVVDVDQDGASELLVTSSVADELGVEDIGRLYTFTGGAIKRVGAFPGLYVDGCAGGTHGKAQAHVVHYRPGAKEGPSEYATELYQAACPATGAPAPADFQPVKPPSAPPESPAPDASPSTAPSESPSAPPSEPPGSP